MSKVGIIILVVAALMVGGLVGFLLAAMLVAAKDQGE